MVDKQELGDPDQSDYGFLIYFGSVAVNVKTEVQTIFHQNIKISLKCDQHRSSAMILHRWWETLAEPWVFLSDSPSSLSGISLRTLPFLLSADLEEILYSFVVSCFSLVPVQTEVTRYDLASLVLGRTLSLFVGFSFFSL